MAKKINDLKKQLFKEKTDRETKSKQFHQRIEELECQNSRVYVGEIAKRLNDYLWLSGGQDIQSLTPAKDDANETVKTMLDAVTREFKISKTSQRYSSSLDAFQKVAEGVRVNRNDFAHPELVHVDTLKRLCRSVP